MQPSLLAPAEVVTGGALKRGPDGELFVGIDKLYHLIYIMLLGMIQKSEFEYHARIYEFRNTLSSGSEHSSFCLRSDATTSSKTVIKFMTDGVLLPHERSLNTDILIGVVSRVFRLRNELIVEERGKIKPLKVIIMSATLRVSDFTQNKTLFKIPPPINVDARQYPVSIHFNKSTPKTDYVTEAFKKVCKIHVGLPHGEITEKKFGKSRHEASFVNDEDQTITEAFKRSRDNLAADAIEIEDLTIDDNPNENNAFDPVPDSLFLAFTQAQLKVFILSIGLSKASADQRAGRAGRTSPGHCYRFYSLAVFNEQFENHKKPKIHRMPIEGVVLQMKAMNIDIVGLSSLCYPALSVGDPFAKEYHLEHEEDNLHTFLLIKYIN
ncbi:hypothetical protein G9A89_023313 [Geosiphon pyriformis]|nr:hypothetical protein G9A89_023313 [Geosiphon pyriformis]